MLDQQSLNQTLIELKAKDEVKFNVLNCKLLGNIEPEKYLVLGMNEIDNMQTNFCDP